MKIRGENAVKAEKKSLWRGALRFSREQREFLKKFPFYFFVPYFGIRLFDWSALTGAVAAFESAALATLGYANERMGSVILAPGAGGGSAFDLVVDCSGVIMIIMFLALYYSAEIPSEKKRGPRPPWPYVPLLFAFNLLRLLATLAVGISFGAAALQAAHFVLWFVDSAVVIACWAHAKRIDFGETFRASAAPLSDALTRAL